jgi:hypothetical protein
MQDLKSRFRNAQITAAPLDEALRPSPECLTPIAEYVKEYSLDILKLDAAQLMILLSARNMEGHISRLNNTPLAVNSPFSDKEILSIKACGPEDSAGGKKLPFQFPTDAMEIGVLRSPHELPDLLPHQWMVEDVAPDIFWSHMIEGKLLRREYLETAASKAEDLNLRSVSKYIGEKCEPNNHTQLAIVLLDASFSMITNDGRGAAARGAALAFAKRAFTHTAKIHFCPFRTNIIETFEGRNKNEIYVIYNSILNVSNAGNTNIQVALDAAAKIINENPGFKHYDIFLLTDGLSKLKTRPPENVTLHTYLVGNRDRTHPALREFIEIDEQIKTLASWSSSFKQIMWEELKRAATITEDDIRSLHSLFSNGSAGSASIGEFANNLRSFLEKARLTDPEAEESLENLKITINESLSFSKLKSPLSAEKKALLKAVKDKAVSGTSFEELSGEPEDFSNTAFSGGEQLNPLLLLKILYKKVKVRIKNIREEWMR